MRYRLKDAPFPRVRKQTKLDHQKVIGKGVLDLGKSASTDGILVSGGSIHKRNASGYFLLSLAQTVAERPARRRTSGERRHQIIIDDEQLIVVHQLTLDSELLVITCLSVRPWRVAA